MHSTKAKIVLGDSLDYMRGLPSKSIDVVLTDPPYGLGRTVSKGAHGFGRGKSRRYPDTWDTPPSKEYFDEILRVSRAQIIFGANYFAHMLPPSRCWLVWDKKADRKFSNPFSDCELIYTSFSKVVKKYSFLHQGAITWSADTTVHPTQKPTELISQIIADWTDPTDVIFDPFLGSGTTAVAAARMSRACIGVEISPYYAALAAERVCSLATFHAAASGHKIGCDPRCAPV